MTWAYPGGWNCLSAGGLVSLAAPGDTQFLIQNTLAVSPGSSLCGQFNTERELVCPTIFSLKSPRSEHSNKWIARVAPKQLSLF
jgi:hypothetical protein